MEYISSDTNVWIDFYKISRTQLPFRMNCKYIMFHEAIENELLYPEDLKSQLIESGLPYATEKPYRKWYPPRLYLLFRNKFNSKSHTHTISQTLK